MTWCKYCLFLPLDSRSSVKVIIPIGVSIVKIDIIDAVVLPLISIDGEIIEIEENDEEKYCSSHGCQPPRQGGGVDKGVEQSLRSDVNGSHGHVRR